MVETINQRYRVIKRLIKSKREDIRDFVSNCLDTLFYSEATLAPSLSEGVGLGEGREGLRGR